MTRLWLIGLSGLLLLLLPNPGQAQTLTLTPPGTALCEGGSVDIEATSLCEESFIYTWDCDGCTGGPLPATAGPHTLNWPDVGQKNITLTATPLTVEVFTPTDLPAGGEPISQPPPPAGNTNCDASIETLSQIDVTGLPATLTPELARSIRVTVEVDFFPSTFMNELGLMLVAPNGQRLMLADGLGNGSQNGGYDNTEFTDCAPVLIQNAPDQISGFPGSYQPQGLTAGTFCGVTPDVSRFEDFAGQDPNGSWTLRCYDKACCNSTGRLFGWSISFDHIPDPANARTLNQVLTIHEPPSANITMPNPAETCTDAPLDPPLSGNAWPDNAAVFSWDFDGGVSDRPLDESGTHLVSWSTPGIKTITYTITVDGCPDAVATEEVSVFPVPAPVLNGPSEVCANALAALTTGGTFEPGASFQWDCDGCTTAPGNVADPSLSWATPGLKTVNVVVTNPGGCTANTALEIRVKERPNPPSPQIVQRCDPGGTGQVFGFSVTPDQPTWEVRWFDAPTAGNLLATGTGFSTPVLTTTTVYYVATFDPLSGCPSTRTPFEAQVIAPPNPPTLDANTVPVEVCGTGSVQLGPTHVNPGTNPGSGQVENNTLRWYENPAGGPLLDQNRTYLTNALLNNKVYYVSTFNPDAAGGTCESNRVSLQININPRPQQPAFASGLTERCGPGTITFTATPGTPPGTTLRFYDRQDPDNLVLEVPVNQPETVVEIDDLPVQRSDFRVLAYDAALDCESDTVVIVGAILHPIPPTVTGVNAVTCVDEPVRILLNEPVPAGNQVRLYESETAENWVAGIQAGEDALTMPPIETDATWYLEQADAGTDCASARTPVEVRAIELADLPAVDTLLDCYARVITLDTTGLLRPFTITWSQGDTGPTAVLREAGSYEVSVFFERANCSLTQAFEIIIPEDCNLTLPNTFTPNADGINDFWEIPGRVVAWYRITVLDRWGRKLYSRESDHAPLGPIRLWDGREDDGEIVQPGSYPFVLEIRDTKGRSLTRSGSLNVLY